jgi:hypothetical protein
MIIWGTKCRNKVLNSGQFHCPTCGTRMYKGLRVAKWFTLYFIPVFPMETLGDYVECQSCKQTFRSEVLEYKPPSDKERVALAVLADLKSGTPIQVVIRKMANHGTDEEVAAAFVSQLVSGSSTRTCPSCRFTYLPDITRCTGCGTSLTVFV